MSGDGAPHSLADDDAAGAENQDGADKDIVFRTAPSLQAIL